jgi:hypothetical protein
MYFPDMWRFVHLRPRAVVLPETTQDYPVLWDHGTAEHERRISGRRRGMDSSPLASRGSWVGPSPARGPAVLARLARHTMIRTQNRP